MEARERLKDLLEDLLCEVDALAEADAAETDAADRAYREGYRAAKDEAANNHATLLADHERLRREVVSLRARMDDRYREGYRHGYLRARTDDAGTVEAARVIANREPPEPIDL